MNNKKPSKKKPARKKKPAMTNFRILAQVEITPEVEEILTSAEAKLYLEGIKRAHAKLQAMIARETGLRRHPGHADHKPAGD